jgi:hypothetical protein
MSVHNSPFQHLLHLDESVELFVGDEKVMLSVNFARAWGTGRRRYREFDARVALPNPRDDSSLPDGSRTRYDNEPTALRGIAVGRLSFVQPHTQRFRLARSQRPQAFPWRNLQNVEYSGDFDEPDSGDTSKKLCNPQTGCR